MRTCFCGLSLFVRQKKRQNFRSCLKFLRVVEITFVEWICVLRATLQTCLSRNFGHRSKYLLRSPRREDIYGNHHIYCRGNYRYLARLYGCNLFEFGYSFILPHANSTQKISFIYFSRICAAIRAFTPERVTHSQADFEWGNHLMRPAFIANFKDVLLF